MAIRLGINPNELAVLAVLNSEELPYLVVGGAAVRFCVPARKFNDVDVFLEIRPETVTRVHTVIEAALGHRVTFSPEDLQGSPKQLKLAPTRNIDIVTRIEGSQFQDLHARRETCEELIVLLPIISRDDLIAVKLSAAERDPSRAPKDLKDVEILRDVPSN